MEINKKNQMEIQWFPFIYMLVTFNNTNIRKLIDITVCPVVSPRKIHE